MNKENITEEKIESDLKLSKLCNQYNENFENIKYLFFRSGIGAENGINPNYAYQMVKKMNDKLLKNIKKLEEEIKK